MREWMWHHCWAGSSGWEPEKKKTLVALEPELKSHWQKTRPSSHGDLSHDAARAVYLYFCCCAVSPPGLFGQCLCSLIFVDVHRLLFWTWSLLYLGPLAGINSSLGLQPVAAEPSGWTQAQNVKWGDDAPTVNAWWDWFSPQIFCNVWENRVTIKLVGHCFPVVAMMSCTSTNNTFNLERFTCSPSSDETNEHTLNFHKKTEQAGRQPAGWPELV